MLIESQAEEHTTKNGLLITGDDVAQVRYARGKVISVGSDVKHISQDDIIYYDKRNTHIARIEGAAYQVVPEACVVIVL